MSRTRNHDNAANDLYALSLLNQCASGGVPRLNRKPDCVLGVALDQLKRKVRLNCGNRSKNAMLMLSVHRLFCLMVGAGTVRH
jgi:hypothetical protein